MSGKRKVSSMGKGASLPRKARRAGRTPATAACRAAITRPGQAAKAAAKAPLQYLMRCHRCGLGLVEVLDGAEPRYVCTTCGRTWYDRTELVQTAAGDRTGFFRLLV